VFGAIVGATEMGSSLADVPGKVAKGSKVEELNGLQRLWRNYCSQVITKFSPFRDHLSGGEFMSSGLTGIEDAEAAFSLLPH
jgi:hypothetical protein